MKSSKNNRYTFERNLNNEVLELGKFVVEKNNKDPLLDNEEFKLKEKAFNELENYLDSFYLNTGEKYEKEKDEQKKDVLFKKIFLIDDFREFLNIRKKFEIDNQYSRAGYKPLLKESDKKCVSWINSKLNKNQKPEVLLKNIERKLSNMKRRDDVERYDFLHRASKIIKTYYK